MAEQKTITELQDTIRELMSRGQTMEPAEQYETICKEAFERLEKQNIDALNIIKDIHNRLFVDNGENSFQSIVIKLTNQVDNNTKTIGWMQKGVIGIFTAISMAVLGAVVWIVKLCLQSKT